MKSALSARHCWDLTWHSDAVLCPSSVFIPAACAWHQTIVQHQVHVLVLYHVT